jgi:hypothetical protein
MGTRSVPRFSFGSKRGTAAVEAGLLIPWLVLSFIGILDFGFCAYGLIATQDAARSGAVWGSATSANAQSANLSTRACTYALKELQYAPNMSSVTTCGGSSPVSVLATYSSTGLGGVPTVSVAVTYSVTLMPIPQIMPATLAITRTIQLPVRN